MAEGSRFRRPMALAALLLTLNAALSGCAVIDPAYLAAAKERYEAQSRKPEAASRAVLVDERKSSHPPYRERECHKCHDAARGGALLAEQAELCYLCHERAKFRHEREHGPVAVGRCSDCHISHENAFPNHTTTSLPQLCLGCHAFSWSDKAGPKEGFLLHRPVREGRCAACHDPHGGARRLFLKADVGDLCLACHDAEVYGPGVLHGPLAVGDCLVCHDPHASETAGLLKARPTDALCLKCHTQQRPKCPSEPGGRECLACHHPHRLTQGGAEARKEAAR